jgi:hypothetical protein
VSSTERKRKRDVVRAVDEDDDDVFVADDVPLGRRSRRAQDWRQDQLAAQAARANDGLNSYFTVHQLDGRGDFGPQTKVFTSNGPPQIDWARLKKILDKVVPMPPAGTHKTVQLRELENTKEGMVALKEILAIVQPLRDAGYEIFDGFIKIQCGNMNPMHQDNHTGENAYLRTDLIEQGFYHPDSVPALRVLIDTTGQRSMVWETKDGTPLLRSEARVCAMDPNAAGCNGRSNVLHGRFGDGITISLDLILPLAVRIRETVVPRRLGDGPNSEFIQRWLYNGVRVESLTLRSTRILGETERRITTEARDRFAPLSALFIANSVQPHCSRCASSDLQGKCSVVEYGSVSHRRRLCPLCALDYNNLGSRKPAQRKDLLKKFVSYTTCSTDCLGCQPEVSWWEKGLHAARAAQPTALESMQERADAVAALLPDGAVADSAEKHCWSCGTRRATKWENGGPDKSRMICSTCSAAIRKASEPITRTYSCTDACTGCRRVARPTAIDRARRRTKDAQAALQTTEPKASETKHCWYCGATTTSRWYIIQVGGVAHFHCRGCYELSRKSDCNSTSRFYNCPVGCSGCIANK